MLSALVVSALLTSIPVSPPTHWDEEDRLVAASVMTPCIAHFVQFSDGYVGLRNPWAQDPARSERNFRIRSRSDGTAYRARLHSSGDRGMARVECELTMPGADLNGALAYLSTVNVAEHTRRQQGNVTSYFEGPVAADTTPSFTLRATERGGVVFITMSGSKSYW
ncbi:MAG: hypothetical protein EON85_12795 [Brevundimonas sp.]|nr:MAG: hypothetical protein EON85_12795 [Brevundimonas sp.]